MRPEAHNRNSCRTSGVILTCYVDGHKRFRPVSLAEDASDRHFEVFAADTQAGAMDSGCLTLPFRQDRRAN